MAPRAEVSADFSPVGGSGLVVFIAVQKQLIINNNDPNDSNDPHSAHASLHSKIARFARQRRCVIHVFLKSENVFLN